MTARYKIFGIWYDFLVFDMIAPFKILGIWCDYTIQNSWYLTKYLEIEPIKKHRLRKLVARWTHRHWIAAVINCWKWLLRWRFERSLILCHALLSMISLNHASIAMISRIHASIAMISRIHALLSMTSRSVGLLVSWKTYRMILMNWCHQCYQLYGARTRAPWTKAPKLQKLEVFSTLFLGKNKLQTT